MAYVKKNLTPEQRSEQARRANAARKKHGGGRPCVREVDGTPTTIRQRATTLWADRLDIATLHEYAKLRGLSSRAAFAEIMSRVSRLDIPRLKKHATE